MFLVVRITFMQYIYNSDFRNIVILSHNFDSLHCKEWDFRLSTLWGFRALSYVLQYLKREKSNRTTRLYLEVPGYQVVLLSPFVQKIQWHQ